MRKSRRELFIVTAFLFSTLLACSSSSTPSDASLPVNSGLSQTTVTLHAAGGEISITAEIAETESQRSIGLMNRPALAENAGMLFIFPENTQGSFWMKDTAIALDIIFIDDGKSIVYIAENTVPYSEELISPGMDYLYVLEVNAGISAAHDINPGDLVEF